MLVSRLIDLYNKIYYSILINEFKYIVLNLTQIIKVLHPNYMN